MNPTHHLRDECRFVCEENMKEQGTVGQQQPDDKCRNERRSSLAACITPTHSNMFHSKTTSWHDSW